MKKIIVFVFLSLTTLSFANFSDETDKDILKKKEYLRQERIEKELREKDTEKYKIQKTNLKETSPTENKFYISDINLTDKDKLLDKIERDRIIEKYVNKKIGSTDITNLLTELTNKLIENGYITSVATISKNNDLRTKVLNLKIVSGKVDKISFNKNSSLNNLKKFFLVKQQEGKVLNIRNLDTTTENFNYLEANNIKMDIIPSDKVNYSNINITNKMKEKFTLSLLTNNHGENKQDSLWRYGMSLNIDSPLGIGDNFYFSYMTVHKKRPNRDWKKTGDILKAGEIPPISPKGFDPKKDTLPYKRNLNLYNFRYTLKFRDYTLSLNSSKTFKENSFYTSNTVYDFKSINKTHFASLNKILWRNQKNKISLGLGLKKKHNKNYLETSTLADRTLAIGNISLNGNFILWKGLLGISLGYERGLRALGAESDKHKIATTPKAEFNKYTLNANYYKPFSDRLAYRLNLSSSYSNDVLYGSEKQSIGGVGSVGGYNRTGTIQGDRAVEIENELSYKIINSEKFGTLSPYISYSYGTVRNNKNKSKYGKGYMSGALLGMRYNMKYFDFDVAYAKPLSHSDYLKPRKHEIYFSAGVKIKF